MKNIIENIIQDVDEKPEWYRIDFNLLSFGEFFDSKAEFINAMTDNSPISAEEYKELNIINAIHVKVDNVFEAIDFLFIQTPRQIKLNPNSVNPSFNITLIQDNIKDYISRFVEDVESNGGDILHLKLYP